MRTHREELTFFSLLLLMKPLSKCTILESTGSAYSLPAEAI